MTWLWTIIAAICTALACGAGTYFLMCFAVGWFRVSSMEGAQGYTVVFMSLYATVAALVVGFIAARVGVALEWTSLGEQIVFAVGTGLAILLVIGVAARVISFIGNRKRLRRQRDDVAKSSS